MAAVLYCVFGVVYIAMFFLFFFTSDTPLEYALSGAFWGVALYMFGRAICELYDIAKSRIADKRAKRVEKQKAELLSSTRALLREIAPQLCPYCAKKAECLWANNATMCYMRGEIMRVVDAELKKKYTEGEE